MDLRRFASVEWKLTAVIATLAIVLTGAIGIYVPAREVALLHHRLEHRTLTLTRLASHEVESAIAFGDQETAREVFDAVALDPDVRSLSLLWEDGRPFYRIGLPSARDPKALLASDGDDAHLEPSDDAVRAVAPVISKEGPRGILVVELSLSSLEAERAYLIRTTLALGLAILLFGSIAARVIAHSIARRVKRLAFATMQIAEGKLTYPVPTDASADEVGQLTRDFGSMVTGIRSLVTQVEEQATQENARLERLVGERTGELDARNSAMRLVLEHVGQGFVTIDARGAMAAERSAILETWFGAAPKGATFAEYIGRIDAQVGVLFADGWCQAIDGFLPLALVIDQLPSLICRDGQSYGLEYTSIGGEDEESALLIVVSDITSEVQKNKSEEEWRDLSKLVERVLSDRTAVTDFLVEAGALVEVIERGDLPLDELRRAVHTLKGNTDLMGQRRIASLCHRLEDRIGETGAAPSGHDLQELSRAWEAFIARSSSLFGDRQDIIMVERAEHAMMLDIAEHGTRADYLAFVQRLAYEPASRRLLRIGEQAGALASRLGKTGLVVSLESNGVRLPAEKWSPFWSAFVHLVRNAVDHGIESPEARVATGKTPHGNLRVTTDTVAGDLSIEISDDGRGIDWEAVRRGAIREGRPYSTRDDLERALFVDGFSTATDVTDVSGRGVGLGAIRQACEKLGGTMSVRSVAGAGTTFCFRFAAARSRSVRASSFGAGSLAGALT